MNNGGGSTDYCVDKSRQHQGEQGEIVKLIGNEKAGGENQSHKPITTIHGDGSFHFTGPTFPNALIILILVKKNWKFDQLPTGLCVAD